MSASDVQIWVRLWRNKHMSADLLLGEFMYAVHVGHISPQEAGQLVPTELCQLFFTRIPEYYFETHHMISSAGGPDGGPLFRDIEPNETIFSDFRSNLAQRLGIEPE
jgi:hypothetical protein